MYRITLACKGVSAKDGKVGAVEITQAFKHRPWHRNVRCEWDGSRLVLHGESDFDAEGKALLDEFSDEISACIEAPFDGDIEVLSITQF